MEIKSEILNDDSMKFVKESLIRASKNDHKENFRVKTVEYINDSSNNHSDMFFYDMLEYLRFYSLEDGGDHIAYTTPDHLIYMVCPTATNGPGEKVRVWEFIYCHECMHQLWETFDVAERIKKNGIEYDHYLLNVASDCIINEYLRNVRKKEPFENGWYPEVLEKEFGVKYDSKKDSQYSLYLKLLEIKKKDQEAYKDLLDKFKDFIDDDDDNQFGDGESSDGGSGEGESEKEGESGKGSQSSSNKDKNNSGEGSNSDIDDMTGEEAANEAKKIADKLKDKAEKAEKESQKSNSKEDKEKADKYKELADEAQQAAKEAQKEAKKGNDDKAKELAKKCRDLLKQAEGNKSNKSSDNDNSHGYGSGTADRIETDAELEKIRKNAEEKIKEYQKKLSGDLSTFFNKCKSSQNLQKEGLEVQTNYGHGGWAQKMNGYILNTVKQRVFQKKRQYQSTYSRVKRGSGFIKFGQPIEPGKKVKEDKLTINFAYYIDRSSSMGDRIDNAFDACYNISDSIKKIFGRDPYVDKTEFRIFSFDEEIRELKWGKKCDSNGGTAPFHKILDFIIKNTKDCLINVMITDGEFEVKSNEIKNLINNLEGIILFITNTPNDKMEDESKKYKTKLFYIEADTNFTLNNKK